MERHIARRTSVLRDFRPRISRSAPGVSFLPSNADCSQNFSPSGFSAPHFAQRTRSVLPPVKRRRMVEILFDALVFENRCERGDAAANFCPRCRSWISTSSWTKNLSRPITYLRKDLAKGQRQLRRVLGRFPSQRFDDVPELVGAQRDRLQ